MTKLRFDGAAVRELARHAWTASQHTPVYGETAASVRPGLILVKDAGIYLMSNGKPALTAGDPANPARQKVVYAKGYAPATNADIYDDARDAVGGDDFAESLALDKALIADIENDEFAALIVDITPTQIKVLTELKTLHTSRARLTAYLAPKLVPGRLVWLGIKKGGRTVHLWSLPVDPAAVDALAAEKARTFRKFVRLSGLTVEQAVEAYAKAYGYTLDD